MTTINIHFIIFVWTADHEERGNGSENKKMITWFIGFVHKLSKLQEKKRIVYIIDVVQFFGISSHLTRLTMKISQNANVFNCVCSSGFVNTFTFAGVGCEVIKKC